jgi:hypothetical protein
MIKALPATPTIDVETTVIDCLSFSEFLPHAARYLSSVGSWRAIPALRAAAARADLGWWPRSEAVRALGDLQDEGSIDLLAAVAQEPKGDLAAAAIRSLGAIGTAEAAQALLTLKDNSPLVDQIAGALVTHGSARCATAAIEIAVAQSEFPAVWLTEALSVAFFSRRWRTGRAASVDPSFVEFAREHRKTFATERQEFSLVSVLERLEGPSVTQFLRELAAGGNPAATVRSEDQSLISRQAYRALATIGDSWAIPGFVSKATEERDRGASIYGRDLLRFDRDAVALELRSRLAQAREPALRERLIRLLGFFGTRADSSLLSLDLRNADSSVANAAYEASLRLADPARLPYKWSHL